MCCGRVDLRIRTALIVTSRFRDTNNTKTNTVTIETRGLRSKRDGTRAETRFGLTAKRTSPFISAGVSVQSTAGSRGMRISGQQLYYL